MPSSLPSLTHATAPPPTWRIQLELIDPNPYQPRSEMNEAVLEELIASIRDHGLLQPITVRRVPGGRYQLIAGTGLELDRVKRLLLLSRVPKVIQDACHQGVLIEQVDPPGTLKLLPSGKTKRQRFRLEVMAALEFAKLHTRIAKASPKKADERTSRAIERALFECSSFRRVQAFCRATIANAEAGTPGVEQQVQAAPLPLFTDGVELRVRRSQLRTAGPEERMALLEILKALIGELAA